MRRWQAELDKRQPSDDPGTVAALPAGDKHTTSGAHAVRNYARSKANEPTSWTVRWRPVVERYSQHLVAWQVWLLVLLRSEDDDVERDARSFGRCAALRKQAARQKVRVAGHFSGPINP